MGSLGFSISLAAIFMMAGLAVAQESDPFGPISEPALAWMDGDEAGSFVKRVRDVASPLGGDCEADRQAFGKLADGLRIRVDRSGTAGEPLAVDWRIDAASTDAPAWLVVSSNGPVRFTGNGFYALQPGAIGPFGIADGQGGTRALVALFSADAARRGSFGIVPLRAGPLYIKAGIWGFIRRCGEEWSQSVLDGAISVAVSSNAVFMVRDPFSFDEPIREVASPDGASSIQQFDGRYRLVDKGGGGILADREGREARYSPTGRFVVAQVSRGFEVLDAVDGALLASGASGDVAWENADSFMVVGQSVSGTVAVRNTLVEGRVSEASLDCTVCPGMATRLNIDLENDLILQIGGQGYLVARLGGGLEEWSGMIDAYDEDIMKEAIDAISGAAAATGAAPLHIPSHWNFRGGLRLSYLAEDHMHAGSAHLDAWLHRMQKAVQPVVEQTKVKKPPEQLEPTEIGQGRGAVSLARTMGAFDRMPGRLAEFGIAADDPVRPTFRKSGLPDGEEDLAIAARIQDAVPWTKGLFQPKDFGCLPEDGNKLYAYFDEVAGFTIGDRSVWITLFSCKWTANGAFEPGFYLFDSDAEDVIRLGSPDPRQSDAGRCDSTIAACSFEAALFGDRHLLIWSRASRALLLYDLTERAVVIERYGLGRGDLLHELRYSRARDAVVQYNDDGSFFLHDARSGTTLLEGRYVDDEVVAWSADLRFDATAEGANYVALRFPGQPGEFTFQQYRRQLRSAGHVQEVMARRYRARQATLGIPPGLSGSVEERGDRLVGTLAVREAAQLRVYQDGLRTDTLDVEAGATSAAFDIQRVAGARWVSIVATGRDGLASRPLGRELTPGKKASLARLHVLTVGVDRYNALGLSELRFAGADARTLRDAFASLDGASVDIGTLVSLVDDDARPEAILRKARQMVAEAGESETVVFSFAGHGLTGPDGRFYMATTRTDLAAVATTSLAWDDLVEVLKGARARVVVLLDACHSGVAGTGLFATNDKAAEGLLDQVPSGLLVFSASKGRQFSEEVAQLGGGVFSNAVADVISRQRAAGDLDGNGAIEASELYTGVKRRVSELTAGRQVPWLARNELIGDFALF